MKKKIQHRVGDLVCWNMNYDILGQIMDIKYNPSTGTIYTVEWFVDENFPYCLPRSTHTYSGVCNLKLFLQERLKNRE